MRRTKAMWIVVNITPGYSMYAMRETRSASIEEFCSVPGPLEWRKARAAGWRCVRAKIAYEVRA